MVQGAIGEAGVKPADTLMIGDSIYDMEMARAAGAYAIGVTWGYHRADALIAAGAQQVIEDFVELVPSLERLWDRAAACKA
jgi:phosphoglycolate phosphatase